MSLEYFLAVAKGRCNAKTETDGMEARRPALQPNNQHVLFGDICILNAAIEEGREWTLRFRGGEEGLASFLQAELPAKDFGIE
jgi:hypothetical protein